MGKREEFEGKQQAVMYQHTHNQIFQERKNPHCTDGRNQCIQRVTRHEQPQESGAQESQQHRSGSVHPRCVGKDVDSQPSKECPQHQRIAGSGRLKLQYQVDIQKWSGISCNMHIVQYQHLQQYQAYEPSYFMQIIN